MFEFKQQPTKDLSVIIPFVQEYPQIGFTINNVFCELFESGIDFEVIAIDNWCDKVAEQLKSQNKVRDKGSSYIEGLLSKKDWFKYLKYDKKLSHWQAKNLGVSEARGEYILFLDAHCIISKNIIVNAFKYYKKYHKDLHGTLHLPLTYMLERPDKGLIYKLFTDLSHAVVHYQFTPYRIKDRVHRNPCMSTCGMLLTRDIFNALGGWPEELGIYGGGEHFINFTLAILGYYVNIFQSNLVYHFADKRGYHWYYDDYHRNRCIASYMYGGEDFARKYVRYLKGSPQVFEKIYYDVVTKCREHRNHIVSQQKMKIEEWVDLWETEEMKNYPLPKVENVI